MSEITEQDAREAAIDIVDGHYGESNEDLDQWHDDIRTCSRWIVQELSRRDAERAEREKPIDAEWCVNNGAIEYDAGHELVYGWDLGWCEFNWRENRGCRMYVGDYHFHVNLPQETRGQLLDLLRALKGGVS